MKQTLIHNLLKAAITADSHIHYALAYGSFTQGTGDKFSDLEYYLYSYIEDFDVQAWLSSILSGTPYHVLHTTLNEFGTPNFILSGLIRLELHVHHPRQMPELMNWPNENIHPETMLMKDQGGILLRTLQELAQKPPLQPQGEAQEILNQALNWLVFGWNVLCRGERLRAAELLWWIRGHLLRLIRLSEMAVQHWLNPVRLAEWELSRGAIERYSSLLTELEHLEEAYDTAWDMLKELADVLHLRLRTELQLELDSLLTHAARRDHRLF